MALLRAAFEQDDGTVSIVVLCSGCYAEITDRLSGRKHWSRPLDNGWCEFCMDEVRRTATSN